MTINTEFIISRIFNAPREAVWNAWTNHDQLMQWFGPKGCKIISSKLALKPSGIFHYGMQMPDGSVMWGKWTFKEIAKLEKLVVVVSFSDEKGGVTHHPFSPSWPLETLSTTTFAGQNGKTALTLRWQAHNATPEEQKTFDASHDSMQQGWTGTMEQLEAYLAQCK